MVGGVHMAAGAAQHGRVARDSADTDRWGRVLRCGERKRDALDNWAGSELGLELGMG